MFLTLALTDNQTFCSNYIRRISALVTDSLHLKRMRDILQAVNLPVALLQNIKRVEIWYRLP